MSVGLVFDEMFLQHRAPVAHPECPERLVACVNALKDAGLWQRFSAVPCRALSPEEAKEVHEAAYLERLYRCQGQAGFLDADTYLAPQSVEIALLAAGGVVELAAGMAKGELRAGLALVRPPGHHAERARGMGFCLLCNIAYAANVFRQAGQRVAILDFDVHHGNGTQEIFYRAGDVLFVSTHRYGLGFYPGTGASEERGEGQGKGTTLNIPLPAGSGNEEHLQAFDTVIEPAVSGFRPHVLLVSAGFDAHRDDPLGGQAVDDQGFLQMSQRIASWAEAYCDGKWLAVLEGGYDLPALARGVVSLTKVMFGAAGRA